MYKGLFWGTINKPADLIMHLKHRCSNWSPSICTDCTTYKSKIMFVYYTLDNKRLDLLLK